MRRLGPLVLSLALALVLANTTRAAASPEGDGDAEARPGALPVGEPEGSTRTPYIRLGGYFIPAMKVRTGFDRTAFGFTGDPEADPVTGRGFTVRLGAERGDADLKAGLGFRYAFTEHKERVADGRLNTHSVLFEAAGRAAFTGGGPIGPYVGLTVGVGGAVLDFSETSFKDTGGAALDIGLEVGVTLFGRVDLGVMGNYFIWGYPSDTLADGAYLGIGGTIHF